MKAKRITQVIVSLLLFIGGLNAQEVYVAGSIRNAQSKYTAGYWKNGTFTSLGEGVNHSYARSVFVSGEDVYVGGFESNGTKDVAKYWKNGTVTEYSDGIADNAAIRSVVVDGSDVYLAGNDKINNVRVAVYWKNGVRYTLGSRYSMAQSIFVSGDDIYIAGFENNTSSPAKSEAKYWKNGTEVILTGNEAESDLYAYSIYVVGEDVYVAGYEYTSAGLNIPKYWKNGVATNLSEGTNAAKTQVTAQSIFVSGEDVYVSGCESATARAKYWKNGAEVILGVEGITSFANSIYIHNADVYIAGFEGSKAKYWKNDVATILSNDVSSAYSIMVVGGASGMNSEKQNSIEVLYNYSLGTVVVKGTEGKSSATIYDITGKQLLSKTILNSSDNTISASGLSSGIYVAKVVTDDGIFNIKFKK